MPPCSPQAAPMSVAAPPPLFSSGQPWTWSLGRPGSRGLCLDSAGHAGPCAVREGAGAVGSGRERRVRVMDRAREEGFLQEVPAGLPEEGVVPWPTGPSLAQGQTTAAPRPGHQPLQHRAATHHVPIIKISSAAAVLDPHAGRRQLTAAVPSEAAGRPGAGSRGAQNSVPVRL